MQFPFDNRGVVAGGAGDDGGEGSLLDKLTKLFGYATAGGYDDVLPSGTVTVPVASLGLGAGSGSSAR